MSDLLRGPNRVSLPVVRLPTQVYRSPGCTSEEEAAFRRSLHFVTTSGSRSMHGYAPSRRGSGARSRRLKIGSGTDSDSDLFVFDDEVPTSPALAKPDHAKKVNAEDIQSSPLAGAAISIGGGGQIKITQRISGIKIFDSSCLQWEKGTALNHAACHSRCRGIS